MFLHLNFPENGEAVPFIINTSHIVTMYPRGRNTTDILLSNGKRIGVTQNVNQILNLMSRHESIIAASEDFRAIQGPT